MEYVADDVVQHFSLGLFEKLLCPLQTADMWQESAKTRMKIKKAHPIFGTGSWW
jgi:hypothetical protein